MKLNILINIIIINFILAPSSIAQSVRDKLRYQEDKSNVEEQMRRESKEIEDKERGRFLEKIRKHAYIINCHTDYYAFLDGKVHVAQSTGYNMGTGNRENYTVDSAKFENKGPNKGIIFYKKNEQIFWDVVGGMKPIRYEFYPSSLMMYIDRTPIREIKCDLIQNPK